MALREEGGRCTWGHTYSYGILKYFEVIPQSSNAAQSRGGGGGGCRRPSHAEKKIPSEMLWLSYPWPILVASIARAEHLGVTWYFSSGSDADVPDKNPGGQAC